MSAPGDERVLRGRLREPDRVASSVVRVFLSSTFTDTALERNAILEHALPVLRAAAQARGLEFQVSEMRWGVTAAHGDRHETTALCMREIAACQAASAGVSFVSLLAQKYGFRPFPAVLPAPLFDRLLQATATAPEEASSSLLRRWYVRDDNAVPPVYTLQPITAHHPDYAEATPGAPPLAAAAQAAQTAWWAEFASLQSTLRAACQAPAAQCTPEEQRLFIESVTAAETRLGLGPDPTTRAAPVDARCVWFCREFTSSPAQLLQTHGASGIRRFFDVTGDGRIDVEAQSLLASLKATDMPATGLTRVHRYNVAEFVPSVGLDPAAVAAHKTYLAQFLADFEAEMRADIDTAAAAAALEQASVDPQYAEAVQHARACRELARDFVGRTAELQSVASYLTAESSGSLAPFVVHGDSGVGKASLLAVAALQASDAQENCVVVVRFLGTTAQSSTGPRLLGNLCQHLDRLYPAARKTAVHSNSHSPADEDVVILSDGTVLPNDLPARAVLLAALLSRATGSAPLVLFLAGLDRLRRVAGARELKWLPKRLPPHVHLVVSTLPDSPSKVFGCLPVLQKCLPAGQFLAVAPFPTTERDHETLNALLATQLQLHSRRLTSAQHAHLLAAVVQCPLPLYAELAASRASTWTSTAGPAPEALPPSVHGLAMALFDRLEHDHGALFVQRALGYLTAARFGLTAQELEDVVSCDDDVLATVFVWWTPPVRRCPPLLVAQLRAKLDAHLVVRGGSGGGSGGVLAWRHRPFTEAARARYVEPQAKLLHSALADYFAGTWADKPKPYPSTATSAPNTALRGLTPQPFLFPGPPPTPNFRKLDELAYHLFKADRPRELAETTLNPAHFQAKWMAFGQADADSDLELLQVLKGATDAAAEKFRARMLALPSPAALVSDLKRDLSVAAKTAVADAHKGFMTSVSSFARAVSGSATTGNSGAREGERSAQADGIPLEPLPTPKVVQKQPDATAKERSLAASPRSESACCVVS